MKTILDLWTSSQNSDQARQMLDKWAVKHVFTLVDKEAKSVMKSEDLRMPTAKNFDSTFGQNFSLLNLYSIIEDESPHTCRILQAIGTSKWQLKAI